jgi:hypothetical protein
VGFPENLFLEELIRALGVYFLEVFKPSPSHSPYIAVIFPISKNYGETAKKSAEKLLKKLIFLNSFSLQHLFNNGKYSLEHSTSLQSSKSSYF